MIEYLKYFFDPNHLFTLRPGAMHSRAVMILLIAFSVMIVAGLLIKLYRQRIKDGLKIKALDRLFRLLLAIGVLGLIYLFFAWQCVVLLAARFWLLAIIISGLVWLGFILKYLLVEMPKLRHKLEQKRKFEKYLP